MSEHDDLHAQIAVRLFGWHWRAAADRWMTPDEEPVLAEDLPAYSTDPAATAQVWQWLETQRLAHNWQITFAYWPQHVSCRLTKYVGVSTVAHAEGATWPEALCRAALAKAPPGPKRCAGRRWRWPRR